MKKLKNIIKKTKEEIKYYSGIIPNFYKLLFANVKKPALFKGFKAYEIGKMFADKRTKKYNDRDQMGKDHGVFAASDDTLIVLNRIELKRVKKMAPANSWIALKMNPRKYIKRNSYYKTESK